MVCAFCASSIEEKFKEVKGVQKVLVDFKTRVVIVGFEGDVTMSDQEINALILDAGYTQRQIIRSEDSPEALYAGTGATIHHIGIESDDLVGTAAKLVAAGCTLLSEPTSTPVKYRAPDGTIAELIPMGSGKVRAGG
jgi:copper chaperone CopZ